MRLLAIAQMLLAVLTLSACDGNSPGDFISSFSNYQDTGDLPALREHGVIRLLAPQFDEPSGLIRDGGVPTEEYQQLAEKFVESLGLKPRWVYADNYQDLETLLLAGKADIVVTNYSVTAPRKAKMAFSAPLKTIQERLVLPPAKADKTLADLEPLQIAVPAGTSYQETAEKLASGNPDIDVKVLHDGPSNQDLVDAVASGKLASTIVDSNLLDFLLVDRDDVIAGPVVNRKRQIAWAVRPDNHQLLDKVNQFITHNQVLASNKNSAKRDWLQIKKSGVLRVITTNNPASYFIWRGEFMGFDYDLIKDFANHHGLRISVLVRDTPSAMLQALDEGEGDVIAASVTDTRERRQQGWSFTDRYLEVHEQLIGPKGADPINNISDLEGRTIAVNPETSYMETLQALKDQDIDFEILPVSGASTEMLIDGVADGDYDLTLADSHLADIVGTYRQDIQVLYQFPDIRNIAWAVLPGEKELKKHLNAYIHKNYRGLFYNVTFNRYFKEKKTIASHEHYRVEPGKSISPYDKQVKKLALKYGFDWRLIMAQMYQESRFNPNAHSFAGAQGLLQVLPRTARQFGFSNLKKPAQGIAAGMAYLDWLSDRFPVSIGQAERLYFCLAAYNAGHGHVEDARRLAQKLGLDPNRWFGQVEKAMLLLSKPQYARQARYGYVRGMEPVKYVRKIKSRYLGYVDALAATQ